MLPLIGRDLRTQLPSSRARLFSRVAPFDVLWAGISPILAFVIRDGTINRVDDVVIYGCVALIISVVVFQWFRISSSIASFFSVHDAITVAKGCLTAVALTAAMLFIFTRLDYAPRAIPVIHFLLLVCGLISVRAWGRLNNPRHAPKSYEPRCEELESIIVIGATRLAWFFSMMVEEFSSRERRIVAIIDESPRLVNRTLNGYTIVGLPENLSSIIDEYATHGVAIRKVVVAAHPKELTGKTQTKVLATCQARNIPIEWLHETFLHSHATALDSFESPIVDLNVSPSVTTRAYWKIKRLVDVVVALAMLVTLAPLTVLVAGLVLIDVGFPIVFWQQRLGYLGRPLRVYKFRTMRSSFDRAGQRVPESARLSALGGLLRSSHLDEIPQLFNILTGSMSLVGPRPLLPADQPKNIRLRLDIRPGLTGLAQISGGISLSPDEKDALDEWYIQHASLLLDLRIIARTLWVVVRGNPRDATRISIALAERSIDPQRAFVHITGND
jgi:lipopolysaccharide/colanic/teichoic acid biosynthesis glycosyltransferase